MGSVLGPGKGGFPNPADGGNSRFYNVKVRISGVESNISNNFIGHFKSTNGGGFVDLK